MKPLLFPLQLGFLNHQVRFGGLVAFFVNQLVQVAARELVELLLNEGDLFAQLTTADSSSC